MTSKFVHRITAPDSVSRQRIAALLAELQRVFIHTPTPIGNAVGVVIRNWRQEDEDTFVVEFSPLAAERLPDLSGLELLQAARGLAQAA